MGENQGEEGHLANVEAGPLVLLLSGLSTLLGGQMFPIYLWLAKDMDHSYLCGRVSLREESLQLGSGLEERAVSFDWHFLSATRYSGSSNTGLRAMLPSFGYQQCHRSRPVP